MPTSSTAPLPQRQAMMEAFFPIVGRSSICFTAQAEEWGITMRRLYRVYLICLVLLFVVPIMTGTVFAVDDMWTVAKDLIIDIYNKIVSISTVLAGTMSAVAVIGAKLSNTQHKTDQAWDWLKRIWIAWAIINGIGAFIAYIGPQFEGLATLTPLTE